MLISLEGLPGAGKTTQARLLANHLRASGLRVTYLPDLLTLPADGVGAQLFALFASSGDPFMRHGDVVTDTLLAAAIRAEILATHIEPALAAGHVVIEDRGADTMYSYSLATLHARHTVTTDNAIAWLRTCGALAGREADLAILLRLPPDQAHAQVAQRTAVGWNPEQQLFLAHVARAYDDLEARFPRITTLEAGGPRTVDEVHSAVRDTVARVLAAATTSSGDSPATEPDHAGRRP